MSSENPTTIDQPGPGGESARADAAQGLDSAGAGSAGADSAGADAAGADAAGAGSTGAGTPEVEPAPPPPTIQAHPFSYTGRAADYFRIWIVNLLLTLVTLGLWSPWAKVRKRRYFYGHTWVAGANFEYHGQPAVILRGRLLAAAAFGLYWVVDHLDPAAGPWLLLLLVAGAPWIVARSLQFNAANSSHRGIRFRFDASAREVATAIWPLALWPVVLILGGNDPEAVSTKPVTVIVAMIAGYVVLALAYPYAMARVRRLTVARSAWGGTPFTSALRTRSVYAIYGIAGLLLLGAMLIVGVIAGILFAGAEVWRNAAGALMAYVVPSTIFLVYALSIVGLVSYTRSRIGNLVFNTARCGRLLRFQSTVSARRLARLYLGNLFAIVFSAGLLIPWAVIRVARYRVGMLRAETAGPLAGIAATVVQRTGAAGEELGEAFGFDLSL